MSAQLELLASAMIDGPYRYDLTRRWAAGPIALWVMLNPSTADDVDDDHTVRRCRYYAAREGCGALAIVNLFAWRATNPRELRDVVDPVGPENRFRVRAWLASPGVKLVIVAWGGWMPRHVEPTDVVGMAREQGRTLWCLGTSRSGAPRHPARLPNTQPVEPWGHA